MEDANKFVDVVLGDMDFFTPAEIKSVKKGEVVQRTLDSVTNRELAAGFAMTMKVDREKLRTIFMESSIKEETDDTIRGMGHIDPENPDFSGFKLEPNPKEMIKAYVTAKPSADLNLSKEEISMLHALGKHSKQEQVEEVFRKILTSRFQAYQQKGLEGIAPYARSKETYEPGEELKVKTDKALILKKMCPEFHKYIMGYPNYKPPKVEEAFTWINFTIDDKPCVCLVHKLGLWSDKIQGFVFYQRHFYVARGHNSVQGLGVAYPTEKAGEMLVVYSSRTSTDQVTGFGGAAKRGIGARVMCGRLAENFSNARKVAEKK